MNSLDSKSFKSSIFSPTPTNLTGNPSSFAIASTIAPFAEPSSLVRATAVKLTHSLNTFAAAYYLRDSNEFL